MRRPRTRAERRPPLGWLGGGTVGDAVTAGPVAVPLSWLALAVMAALAVVGWVRGLRRELITLVLTALSYWLVAMHWPAVTARLAPFVDLNQQNALAQIGVFGLLVLVAYLIGARARPPGTSGLDMLADIKSLFERLLGAAAGGATGYLVGRFVIDRLTADDTLAVVLSDVDPTLSVQGQGAKVFWVTVAVFIAFGVMSLAPGKKKSRSRRSYD